MRICTATAHVVGDARRTLVDTRVKQVEEESTLADLLNNKPAISVSLRFVSRRRVIGVGGDLKSSICIVEGGDAAISHATGDLSDASHYRQFIIGLEAFAKRAGQRPQMDLAGDLVVAHDLHPTYLSTTAAKKLASELGLASCEAVQHHHAHVVACMAEHGLNKPVVGIACDGTGYGSDGAIWGCEILNATCADFERSAHLQYFPLPGGDIAAKQTWRPSLGLTRQAFDGELPNHVKRLFDRVPDEELGAVWSMLDHGFNCPPTSSLGRLFDAVAFLVGVCDFNEYEGQAAIGLQEEAEGGDTPPYPFRFTDSDGGRQIVVSDMIAGVCRDLSEGTERAVIASRFHATVAGMLAEAAAAAATTAGTETVVLSGGCFLNDILTNLTERFLLESGIKRVLRHERLSPGDASLSLGQAVAVAARIEERT